MDAIQHGPRSFQELTPTAFLDRSAKVWRDHIAVVDGEMRLTYAEFHGQARQMAGAIATMGVGVGDRVAVLAPNSSLMLTSHFAVPYAGSVLVALNHRLSDGEIAAILEHSGTELLLVDRSFSDRARPIELAAPNVRVMVDGPDSALQKAIRAAPPLTVPVDDERGLLAINYTSGTTGRPKGVMYHHRGAYLQSLAMTYHAALTPRSVMLWTLPMFHCNGWCFTWGATAAGSTHICLPTIDPTRIWKHIRFDGVTHLNAAPTVLAMIVTDPSAEAGPAPRTIHVGTGGAPPSPTLIERLRALNFEVTHLYGLTETFGPAVICEWQPAWDQVADTSRLVARQGVGNIVTGELRVVQPDGERVPADGETMGEVRLRGNNVMLGYYKDQEATAAAASDGWFRTGDLGVIHPDGYMELRDRAKDIIISGGENIPSVEVEQSLASHPDVLECAVVAQPDDKWGEVPVAYVTLVSGGKVTSTELVEHVRSRIARFKAPRRISFVKELPKTSTGKIRKDVLRHGAGDAG